MTLTNLPLLRVAGVLFGVGFTVIGMTGMKDGMATSNWPSAQGKVIVSEKIGMGDHTSGMITAEYRLDDGIYHCGKVTSGRDNSPRDVKDFPVGSEIEVFYDPDNQARCVLVPGISWGSIAFLATGLVFFGLAAFAHRRIRAGAT